MKKVNHKELRNVLKVAYKSKSPYFCWGTTGIGKSYTIRELAIELAKEENKEFIEWNNLTRKQKLEVLENVEKYFLYIDQRALQFDLGDFKLPKFDNENGIFEWCIPMVYEVICKEKARGILFFDEFNLAPPSIQGMFYQIINDKQIGENKISWGVWVVGAGNRLEDRANIYEMSKPLQDRFEHITLAVPSLSAWTNWALNHEIDSRIISFLHFKPSYLFKLDPKSKDKAFPTPRGWEKLSNMIENVEKDYELLENIIASNVGEATGIEMISFLKLSKKIELEDFLKNPEKIKEIKEIDLKYSIVSEITQFYKKNKENLKKIMKLVKLLEPEFAILCLRMLRSVNERHFVRNTKKFVRNEKYDWIGKYAKYLV